ncbi:hypothetical protein PVL29_018643 [Vitis rotundifolia]|uniref:Aminotransferase-like plant mobile domain-containing protein n=1 Tax=Vitis rotundifolia TaxID=103349 RepID=A0AA38Z5H1_VITRO|nr:hypothetical protein PVL29_018643 [Vitis rotundifolia]
MQSTRLYTRCSSSRFLKLCNRLPAEKLDVEIRHNICIWLIDYFNVGFRRIDITSHKRYDLTTTDVGLVFGLPTTGRILHIATTPSDRLFGTLNTCEERLLNLPIREEFRRCFIYYTCAMLLAPTSRIDGYRNLWHTIHEDGFRNDVNWGQFVVDQLVEGIRRFKQRNSIWVHGCILFLQYQQVRIIHMFISMVQLHYVIKFKIPSVHVPMTAPLLSAWSDELIKERLSAEISEFGSFGHGEGFDESSPARTHVEDESGQTSSHQQLGIMRGLIHRLDAQRERGVHSPIAGHSGYAADDFPEADHDSPYARYDMPFHGTEEVLDTPIRHPPIIADDEVVVCDPLPLRSMTVARSHKSMDLKEAAAIVFDGDLDPSEELVSMHDTSLTKGNLASFQGDCWIGIDVNISICPLVCIILNFNLMYHLLISQSEY